MTGKAKIYALPSSCFRCGMVWPAEWIGPAKDAHLRAMAMCLGRDITVEYEDRIVSYHNGITELVETPCP